MALETGALGKAGDREPGPSSPAASSSLQIPPALASSLREHQVDALHFLWHHLVDEGLLRMAARTHSSTLEQRALLYQEVYGCIVGHSMGLGKTLTALAFLLLLQAQVMLMSLKKKKQTQAARRSAKAREGPTCPALRVLVVCPKSCVRHWLSSAEEWVRPELFGRVSLPFFAPSTVSGNGKSVDSMLEAFHTSGGVLVLGYEEYARLTQSLEQRPAATDWNSDRVWSALDNVRQRLPLRPKVRFIDVVEGADVVVLDEAHRLKRAASRLVQALRKHLRNVQVRVALTGTPLQNHLEEYNVMRSVVTGSDLDSHHFNRYFVSPIQMGQCADSSFQQFSEMQRCVAALRRYFASTVHHCGPEELERVLPPRREFVFFFSLSAKQEEIYRALLRHFRAAACTGAESSGAALPLHHQASHICLHPCLVNPAMLVSNSGASDAAREESAVRNREEEKSDNVGVDSDSDDDDDEEESAGNGAGLLPFAEDLVPDTVDPTAAPTTTAAAVDLAESPKLLFAVTLVEHITKVLGEKVVVFSLYRSHLRLLQTLLQERLRLDGEAQDAPLVFSGETPEAQRAAIVDDFKSNPRRRVVLCSVRAGGVGINLSAANHCILLDVSWNPSDDTQATYRIYRFGQRRPVTIYRLATHGTTEQVVFAYALHKSWMHRKIADVADPARQERHAKRGYFVYPCRAPLDDGAPHIAREAETEDKPCGKDNRQRRRRHAHRTSTHGNPNNEEEENDQSSVQWAAEREVRAQHFLHVCERECPEAAQVVQAEPVLQHSLFSVVRRSFLLRDESAETVAEMENRFREMQRRKEAQMPIGLADEDDGSLIAAARVGQQSRGPQRPASLLDECETALVDAARTAASHVIWYVVQRRHDVGLSLGEADTTAVVREADRALCSLLHPLLEAGLTAATATTTTTDPADTKPPSTFPSSFQHMHLTQAQPSPPPFAFLAEALLFLYQVGARHAVSAILSQSSFTKLRTYLTSRIPQEILAASTRRPRRSTLTHGILEDALLYRPYELLSRVDPVEQTYLATEIGFTRPFVEQCVFLGLHQCFARLATLSVDDAEERSLATALRTLLRDYFCEGLPRPVGGQASPPFSEEDDDSTSDGDGRSPVTLSQAEAATRRLDVLAPQLTQAMERCLSDLWPSGAGFLLPSLCLHLSKEERRTAQSYHFADCITANTGVMAPDAAAATLGLTRSQVRSSLFVCPRCKDSILTRTADTVLGCVLCHYNAEFALRNNPRCQQPMALFQLSFTCNLLDAFSTSRSFSVAFVPSSCRTVWEALLKLRAGKPTFRFVEKCTTDGVDVLLSEFPAKHVQLLALQSGAGDDKELLRRMLLANASLVWGERLRRHVRDGLAQCFRDLVKPCALATLASMPLMCIVLSLHLAVRHEDVRFAAELLEGEGVSNVYSASATGGRRRALLRFACDGLVKLLYAEKLLEHCRVPPSPKGKRKDDAATAAEGQPGASAADGGFEDIEEISLPSTTDASSSSTSRTPPRDVQGGDGRNAGAGSTRPPALETLIRQPSPSSSSSSSSSRGGSGSRPPRRKRARPRTSTTPLRKNRCGSVSSSGSSSWLATPDSDAESSSSFGSQYSDQRESFPATATAAADGLDEEGQEREEGWETMEEEKEQKTAEELEDEATLEQRSAQYWVAFCEVYGTQCVETLTVFVEDEELGMTILPPPPPLFWVSQLVKASKDGKTVAQVIDTFLEKVLELSRNARLILHS